MRIKIIAGDIWYWNSTVSGSGRYFNDYIFKSSYVSNGSYIYNPAHCYWMVLE